MGKAASIHVSYCSNMFLFSQEILQVEKKTYEPEFVCIYFITIQFDSSICKITDNSPNVIILVEHFKKITYDRSTLTFLNFCLS